MAPVTLISRSEAYQQAEKLLVQLGDPLNMVNPQEKAPREVIDLGKMLYKKPEATTVRRNCRRLKTYLNRDWEKKSPSL